ncbi:nuclear transport factor 2 family protein [Thiomonas bhubaneswarensis]|uniref:TPR repeat n=1 Tax=Thiomonas bhubaneswarensis TaxID=339866 RepID=A0A0K6HVS2_9BURK|nr:nuclear transport factor 2 family protein [Thiomonas bhubaneswarensis]CUA95112.1 TPR repeat [Thiomonas bhubaneswarensis]
MRNRLVATLIALALSAPSVWAADAASVTQSLQKGDLQSALQQVDTLLAQKPKDPQYQFLKGVILTEQKKDAQAIKIFQSLTEQYPELPEPYNNLAVLYAQQGQYEKARAALDMAIRTNPSYATAQANLGDIYAKLASQAYQKALQLAPDENANARVKLNLIRELFEQGKGAGNPPMKVATAQPAAAAEIKPAATPPAVKPAVAAPEKPAVKPEPTHTAQAAPPATAPSTNSAPAAPQRAATTEAAPAPAAEQAAVTEAVERWAAAWQGKNLPGYFAAYAPNFKPEKGMSLSAWKDQRRARISDKAKITVTVHALKVQVDGDKATARFRQHYVSGSLDFDGPKTLQLQRENGKWLIVREIVG